MTAAMKLGITIIDLNIELRQEQVTNTTIPNNTEIAMVYSESDVKYF